MKWFAYIYVQYYPYSTVVEAETADEATAIALAENDDLYEGARAVAVAPLESMTVRGTDYMVEDILDPVRD